MWITRKKTTMSGVLAALLCIALLLYACREQPEPEDVPLPPNLSVFITTFPVHSAVG